MGVKCLTECCEKPTVRRHADKPMREDYPQARALASRGTVTAEVALASVSGRQGAVRAPELPMLALSQQQRASSVHRQLGAEGGVHGGRIGPDEGLVDVPRCLRAVSSARSVVLEAQV